MRSWSSIRPCTTPRPISRAGIARRSTAHRPSGRDLISRARASPAQSCCWGEARRSAPNGARRRSAGESEGASPLRSEERRSPPPSPLPHRMHRGEELLVAARLLELVEQQLHGLDGVQLGQRLAQEPDLLQLVLLEQQLLLAGAGLLDVDRREDPLVHEPPI